MPVVIVIGLGNLILTDDAVGILAVREASRALKDGRVTFVEASTGGLDLIDLMAGYRAALLVDAVVTKKAVPGEVLELDPSFLEDTTHLGTTGMAHQVDLATAWKLGRRLGMDLPGRIRIIGVEAADVTSFSETLSPEVARSLPEAVKAVVDAIGELVAETEAQGNTSGSGG